MSSFVDAGEDRRWLGFVWRWLELFLLVVAFFSVFWAFRRDAPRPVAEGSGAPG
jgi:hypothetical protein